MFTVRVGTVMEGTRLPYRSWAIAIYLLTTNLKGISSLKLHRELGITQKSAWFMLHRLRKAAESGDRQFSGPVEADETYIATAVPKMPVDGRCEDVIFFDGVFFESSLTSIFFAP